MRVVAIDRFRGLSICLMVLYSLIYYLSPQLPHLLNHNQFEELHFGDFVLPMFLFSSGMSLVYFAASLQRTGKLRVVTKTLKQFFVVFLISPVSTGAFFGMDEVALNLVLFIPCLLLVERSSREILLLMGVLLAAYFPAAHFGYFPDFTETYLGGYRGAFMYFPIMLAGVLAGRNLDRLGLLFAYSLAATAVGTLLIAPYKMTSSPSFMLLAITVCLATYTLIRHVHSEFLEYLGRRPLRFWILMFLIFVGPLRLKILPGLGVEQLPLTWFAALALSLAAIGFLYTISRVMDAVFALHRRIWLALPA